MERPKRPKSRPGPAALRMFGKGRRLNLVGRFQEAIAAFEEALALEPDYADAHNGLGVARHGAGQPDAAVAGFQRALRIDPGHARAHNNIGTVHLRRNRPDLAIAAYRRAIGLDRSIPEIRVNLAFAQVLNGDLLAGLRNYEYRWAAGQDVGYRGDARGMWRGQRTLRGRSILLLSEQGFGDMMQFVRFIPRVADLGARIHLEAAEPLRRLFKASFPQIESIHAKGDPLPKCDEFCTVLSLASAFGTQLSTIPAGVPYLMAPSRRRPMRIDGAKGAMRIGIAWSGSPGHGNDSSRSIPFERFREILRGSVSHVVSLQKEVRKADRAALAGTPGVADPAGRIRDFADTASVVQELDLVISVDTSVAHLAGALGKPVWLLLAFAPDCRWMLDRTDSPWYPTMRLFRQKSAGDWDSVLNEVRTGLKARSSFRRDR